MVEDVRSTGSVRAVLGLMVLLLLTTLSYVDRTIILLLVEPIKADLGINDVQFSLLTGFSFAAFYAVFGIPFGWLADRFSRRWIVCLGVTTWSIATAMCGFANSFGHLFVARMGVGVGEATLSPVGYAITGDLFSRRRLALASGVLAAGTAIGAALAYGVGGVLMEWTEAQGGFFGLKPWQSAIVLVALPGLILAPCVFVIPRHADRPRIALAEGAQQQAGYGRWLRANLPHLAPMTFGCAMIYAIMFGITAWMPAILFRRFGLSPSAAGGMLGVALGFSGVVGFLASGWIVDRLAASSARHVHLRYMAIVVAMLGVLGAGTFGLATSAGQILVMLAVLSLIAPVNGPALAYLQIHTPPEFRGRTIAIFLLVFNLFGMTIGPSAMALVSQEVFGNDIGAGMALTSVVGGVMGLALFLFAGRKEPVPHP